MESCVISLGLGQTQNGRIRRTAIICNQDDTVFFFAIETDEYAEV